jgi:hypothetical protein
MIVYGISDIFVYDLSNLDFIEIMVDVLKLFR